MAKVGSDEQYTPKYVFDAMGVVFDLDVAAPEEPELRKLLQVPAKAYCVKDSLAQRWWGFVWCNPPYSGRNSKKLWLDKLHEHGNGIALVPDRTSAPWWPEAARKCDALLLVTGKIKFIQQNGQTNNQPENGTTLFAYGTRAVEALLTAERNGLGVVLSKLK